MLNRTNRTLSANLLGLNLGTRTLAPKAGSVNVANATLRIRHSHTIMGRDPLMQADDAMRPESVQQARYRRVESPGSWPCSPCAPFVGEVTRARQGEVVVASVRSKRQVAPPVGSARIDASRCDRGATARAALPPIATAAFGG